MPIPNDEPQRVSILRNAADRRSLFWSIGLFPLPIVAAFFWPQLAVWMLPFTIYLAFCAGVLTHYHNHIGVFRSRTANQVYSLWLSAFYGFPIFSWIPTHNQNHHKHTNSREDKTSTFRSGKSDGLVEALIYPVRSSAWQLPAVSQHLALLKRKHNAEFAWALGQIAAVIFTQVVVAAALVSLHGLGVGLTAYAATLFVPALFAPYAMMFINYLQHVGCDPNSADDHSRNFVGSWENWLVFQAGLHTVHHEHPGTHWSEYPKLHRARSQQIHPVLQQRNVFAFLFSRYGLGRSEHLLVPEAPWGDWDDRNGFSA